MRVDNVVRTERYFCALLLSLLLHDSCAGVRALLQLLGAKGILPPEMVDVRVSADSTQVITELAVKRDLHKHTPGVQLPPEAPRDVIDIVVIVGGLLIAIEAKFFSPTNLLAIQKQLATQREALRLLQTETYRVSQVCQVFLTADPAISDAPLPAVGVLHWSDVCALAEQVSGRDSYIARRLTSALERYGEEFSAGGTGPSWAGVEGLELVLQRCRGEGANVVIGFWGGMTALKARTMAELVDRPFKWDWTVGGQGKNVVKHWIPGNQFLAVVNELKAQDRKPPA